MNPEDILPIDDARDLVTPPDSAEPVIESRQREPEPQRQAEAKEPEAPRKTGLYDDKRNSIVEKLKAQRQAEDRTPAFDIPEDMERRQVGPNINTRADRMREPEDAQTARDIVAEDIPAPTKRKLKVNGREVEVDEAQMTELAQKALASENILEDAKMAKLAAQQRLAEVERLYANQSNSVQQQPVPAANAKAEDTTPATDAELDDIIDRIQTGDIKDGAAALKKYGDQILAKAKADLGDIDARVTATIRNEQESNRIRADTQQVLDAFISENSDFSQSKRRGEVLYDTTVEVMRDNLFAIGVKPEVLEGFARTHEMAPQAAIGFAYRKLISEGHALPDSATVLRTAAGKVRADFGMPDPRQQQVAAPQADNTQFVADRIERKQSMGPQPRRANITPAAEQANERSQEQKRLDAVRQMKAQRRGR